MSVSPDEEARLLAAIQAATERASRAQELADSEYAKRRSTVREAMNAGVRREKIMESARITNRSVLYRLVYKDSGEGG